MEEDITKEVQRLIPFLGKEKAARLEAAYFLGDEEYRKRIVEVIDGIKAMIFSDEKLKESALLEPPSKEIASKGDFELGIILYGKKELYPLFLSEKDLLTHIGIFGSSGSGKTNIVHFLVKSLAKREIPILIFDFSKRNYRDLLATELKERITVYTVGRNVVPFRFNPLVPPEGVQVSQWIKEFAEVFDHAYWLLGGGRHIILKALDELYRKLEPEIPRIKDIKEWIEKYSLSELSPRERNWVATAKRPLESLCLRENGEIFDCEKGILPSSFFEKGKITILELDSLSNDDKTFFIEIILQWIRDWLIVSNKREKLLGVIILEEAHHVLNREKTKKFGIEAVTDLIFREIRELGIGMIYVDQHPSLVSYPALGNTSTHIYMNLGLDTKHSSDVQDAANMLGLREEKDVDYLRRLPVGHAFILIRKSEFPNPFLIKFPLVLVERGIINDEILKKEMEEKILKIKERERKNFEIALKLEKEDIEKKARKVTFNEWRILEALANFEGSYTSEIYKKLKMSCKTFNEIAKRLVELGFLGSRKAKVYKQNAIFYFLTHEGELALILRNNKLPEHEKKELSEGEIKLLEKLFTLNNYRILSITEEKMRIERDGNEFEVNLVTQALPGKIYEKIKNSKKELYFVCSSEKIKNCVIQQAAKYSFEHKGIDLTLYVASIEELKNGKNWKKVEFIPEK
jgi:DNA helicase HerA-like ATPase/DNA-binding MarR family transcriptional regulator